MKMKTTRLTLLAIILMAASAMASPSDNVEDRSENRCLSPYFFIENGDEQIDVFPLKRTDVSVTITGIIAHVTVSQTYANHGKRPINARYIFPATTRAAVHGMQMTIGNKRIVAEIEERKVAEQTFKKAKREGKRAALLNQHRPNVFGMNVANIMPGDTVEVELTYTELLIPSEGIYEFSFPTVVGPRYATQLESDVPETDRWVKSPYLQEGRPPASSFTIVVNISSAIPIQDVSCETHQTDIHWKNESAATVLLEKSENYGGNRDFILKYRLAGQQIHSGLMLYEGLEENFFLLMVQPPERVSPDQIPPREYIFVVDVSGSMHGFPLDTSKQLIKKLISGLRPEDQFNVILFAGGSRIMSHTSLPATPQNIQNALTLIDNQRGGGGTELEAALKKGLALPQIEGVSKTLLILTDGYISAETEVFDMIENNLDHANMFAFGIGTSVNRYLVEGIAKIGRGEPFIVTDPAQSNQVAEKFRRYVSSPVLTNIDFDFESFDAYDVEPPTVPDLFAERPVVIIGKYRGTAGGIINMSAFDSKGSYRKVLDAERSEANSSNSALSYLWARSRVGRLSDFNANRKNQAHKDEITRLGLTYRLLTGFTSFVAVHEVLRNESVPAEDVTQPLPLPKNVSRFAVGTSMSSLPEPGLLDMAFCVLAALVLLFGLKYFRRMGFRNESSNR
jgi:Ca-activated chloride channel family protein